MTLQDTVNQCYACLDDNPKIVKRIYDWNGKLVQFKLCNIHLQDPDFANPVMEEKI